MIIHLHCGIDNGLRPVRVSEVGSHYRVWLDLSLIAVMRPTMTTAQWDDYVDGLDEIRMPTYTITRS